MLMDGAINGWCDWPLMQSPKQTYKQTVKGGVIRVEMAQPREEWTNKNK